MPLFPEILFCDTSRLKMRGNQLTQVGRQLSEQRWWWWWS